MTESKVALIYLQVNSLEETPEPAPALGMVLTLPHRIQVFLPLQQPGLEKQLYKETRFAYWQLYHAHHC